MREGPIVVPGGTPERTVRLARLCSRFLAAAMLESGDPPWLVRRQFLESLREEIRREPFDAYASERVVAEFQRGVEEAVANRHPDP